MVRELSWSFSGYKLNSVLQILTDHLCYALKTHEGAHSIWGRQTQRKNFSEVWLVHYHFYGFLGYKPSIGIARSKGSNPNISVNGLTVGCGGLRTVTLPSMGTLEALEDMVLKLNYKKWKSIHQVIKGKREGSPVRRNGIAEVWKWKTASDNKSAHPYFTDLSMRRF